MQPLTYKSVCLKYCCFRLEEAVILSPFLWQVNFSSPAEWSRCISVRLLWTVWCKGPITALTAPKTMCVEPRPHYCCCYSACCWPSDTIGQRKTMCRVSRVYLRCCPLLFNTAFSLSNPLQILFLNRWLWERKVFSSYHAMFYLFIIC